MHGYSSSAITSALASWLDAQAETLDTDTDLAPALLPALARDDLFRIGVPAALGGGGGTTVDAIEAIANVAEHSLTAAFVFWGHRAFIDYLLQSTNDTLRERVLPALLRADIAGASGLSNAVKFLSKIEPLQMTARALDGHADAWRLNGALPWITNLRKEGFLVAVAADHDELRGPSIFAVPHDVPGVVRGGDLDLIAMRASNTASLQLEGAVLDKTWQIAVNGPDFIAAVRPAFLGLQCGMSIGLARRALSAIDQCGPASRAALADDATGLWKELNALSTTLFNGILDGTFVHAPARAFEVRIRLAALVDAALTLEVQASGGRGYLRAHAGTARRSRESCFIPIITPSVIQLRGQLAQYRDGGTGGTS